jgi:cell division septal protein FtsQ
MSADSGLPGVTFGAEGAVTLVPADILTRSQMEEVERRSALAPPQKAEPKFTIQVYLKNGNVFEYDVSNRAQAREHSAAIVAGGYRSVSEEAPNVLTHWPAHQIEKVKVTGSDPIQTNYFDRQRGT